MSQPELDDASAAKARRSALLIVFLVVFIDLLGFGIVLPLLPLYADVYLADATANVKGIVIGVLFSSFSLMQFIFSPVWGRLSDRIGRRPILIMGLLGSVLFYGLFAYANTFPKEEATLALVLLLISRIGAGIAGASVSTASAVIADCTTPEKRSKGMALIGAAFGIGFTFGPLIGYAGLEIFQQELWAPGLMASILSFIAMILAIVLLPETLKIRNTSASVRHSFSIGRSMEVLKMPTVGPLILMYFLAIFAFANFEATLALYTKEVFSFTTKQSLLVFAGVGFVLVIAQGGFYRRFAGKMSEQTLMKAGLAMMFMGLGGLGAVAYATFLMNSGKEGEPVTNFQSLFYFATAVAVFGFAFVNPSIASLVSRQADATRQGEVLGVNQSFAAIGRILGPMIGVYVFWQHGSHTLPFVVAGAVLLLVVLLLPNVRNTTDAVPPEASARDLR